MKTIEQKPIGNVYFDEEGDYKDVTIEMLGGDECPQLLMTVPIYAFGGIMKHELCVYITKDGFKHLRLCVTEVLCRMKDID